MSSADLMSMNYVEEVTLGVTPATPALKPIRYTGESLVLNMDTVVSNEITPTRVERDMIMVGYKTAGDINFELSYGTFDDFIQGALCGTWTTTTGDNMACQNGVLRRSYTIQKVFQDLSPVMYHNFIGQCVEGMSLKIELGKMIEGSFSFVGLNLNDTTVQFTGATFPSATTTVPMGPAGGVQSVTIDGVPYTGCITSLSLSTKNNMRQIQCIGSAAATNVKLGTLQVTGEVEFHFTEGTNFTKFKSNSNLAMSIPLIDEAGNKYTIDLPRLRYESGEVVAGGKNTDTMFSAKFRALYNAATTRVMTITRDPV